MSKETLVEPEKSEPEPQIDKKILSQSSKSELKTLREKQCDRLDKIIIAKNQLDRVRSHYMSSITEIRCNLSRINAQIKLMKDED